MKKIISAFVLLLSLTAAADQCDWVSPTDATSGLQLINLHKEVMFYCQLCGDAKPSFIGQVTAARTAQADMAGKKQPYRTVLITVNGKEQEVDLAYLYVRTASNIFANVAQLVGCPSEGAVTFIETTNKNSKIQHYYNEAGVRVVTAETSAKLNTNTNTNTPRKPASKK